MHRHGVLATLLSSLAGTLAASCYSDRCLKCMYPAAQNCYYLATNSLTSGVNCGEGCVADCTRHLAVTVTPPPVTITSTVTIDLQLAANVSPNGPESTDVDAAPDCQAIVGFPYWAAVCDTKKRFSSACSCIGASIITTATATTPTSIVIETILASPSILGPSRSFTSSVPISNGNSFPTETVSFIPNPIGAVSSTVPLFTPTGGPMLLAVVPAIPVPPTNKKRRLRGKGAKRQDVNGGFIDVEGTVETCSDGTPFNITTEGQLISDGRAVGTRFGDKFILLPPNYDVEDIYTSFVVVDSVLHWQNTAFDGGEAGFCQVGGSGQVYATFAERATWPPGCDSISIIVYRARQCRNGVIVPELPGDVISSTQSFSPTATVPSTADTETGTSNITFASAIGIVTESMIPLDGMTSTIDRGHSMETSIPARSTAGTTSTQSFDSTEVSNTTPTTSSSRIPSAASDLSSTTTPRSPELSSSSMGTFQAPVSTESSNTPSILMSGEETGVTASPTSVEASASSSSLFNGLTKLGSLTYMVSSGNMVTSLSLDLFTEIPMQVSTTSSASSSPSSLGPISSSQLDAVLGLCTDVFERHVPINVSPSIDINLLYIGPLQINAHQHQQYGGNERRLVGAGHHGIFGGIVFHFGKCFYSIIYFCKCCCIIIHNGIRNDQCDVDGRIVYRGVSNISPGALYLKDQNDGNTPAALWDLYLTTGRLVLSSSISSPPPLAPVLLPPHGSTSWVQLAGTNDIANDPITFAEMTCFLPASSSGTATDPVTGNLVSETPLECMATAPDTKQHYSHGFLPGAGGYIVILGDGFPNRGFQFKVGFGDTCDPPS
ncbi:hypothetical protein PG996_015166 [Apiospora saccharicola]|uniref:DUF7908 domain-containing protein n=1 Tax=Apiospora saccharicola TaxID=335842 RepID=A0ABR1TKI7_9PEZI